MRELQILLIDDNPGDARLVIDLTSETPGFKVHHAATFSAAEAMLEGRPMDVVLLDLGLPDSTGLETLQRARRFPGDPPIVVLSGLLDDRLKVAAIRAGALEVVGKREVSAAILTRALNHAVAREDALRRTRQVERLVAASPDAVVVVDLEGVVRYVNAAAETMFRRPSESFVGELLGFSVAEGKPTLVELVGRGGPRFGEMRVSGVEWEGTHCWLASIRDVTAERLLRSELDEVETRLGNILASSAVVLCSNALTPEAITTGAFTFTMVSEGVHSVLGCDVSDAMEPMWWRSQVHPDDLGPTLKSLMGVLTQSPVTVEYRMRGPDGAYLWTAAQVSAVRDATGRATEMIWAMADVTRRKELERQFYGSQRMEAVGVLAGGIAHDFNNVLTAIFSCADAAMAIVGESSEAYPILEESLLAARRAANLTQQLLAFGRQQVLDPRVVDLNEVVRGLGSLLPRLLREDIRITFDLAEEVAPILADPVQLEQVAVNLVVNARDAMQGGGEMILRTREISVSSDSDSHPSLNPGRYVTIAVQDTGTGMNEVTQARIFEPFFTTKEVGKGTGLGLASVFGIVKQSQGEIWVDSELGKGTTFTICFPRAGQDVQGTDQETSADRPQGNGETVLFVEDDEIVRAAGVRMLRQLGYQVVSAAHGGEVMDQLDTLPGEIDLLVTDVVMPVMGGIALADAIRDRYPEVAILFTSGYSRDAVIQHGILTTDSSFMPKPYTVDALARKLREALNQRLPDGGSAGV